MMPMSCVATTLERAAPRSPHGPSGSAGPRRAQASSLVLIAGEALGHVPMRVRALIRLGLVCTTLFVAVERRWHLRHLHRWCTLQRAQVLKDLCLDTFQILPRVEVVHRRVGLQVQLPVRHEVLVIVVGWQVVIELLVEHDSRLIRPAARHVADRVAPAPEHERRQPEAHHVTHAFGVPTHGEVKAPETITRDRVGAALQHDSCWLELCHHLLNHRLKDRLVRLIVDPVLERHIHGIVLSAPCANILHVTGAREEEVAVFVEGDSHHAIC
mmetsp:Transcript_8363/g.21591  ORF Transcript_8363/g.21591 Transcript_8363/m.21591 type:complete len:270 (+) Transcript_8363:204-1013(+)